MERQVVGEGALHVIVLTGRVHIVSAYLQDRVQNKLSATAYVTAALEYEVCQRIGMHIGHVGQDTLELLLLIFLIYSINHLKAQIC